MLTNPEIQELITMPKEIIKKFPLKGYDTKGDKGTQKYCDLDLRSIEPKGKLFFVFIRQNTIFEENFSFGLRYLTEDRVLGCITLTRYNGPHGDKSMHKDGHYNKPHIHTITANEIQSGSVQPQEKHRQITDKYDNFNKAQLVFFRDMGIINYSNYFSDVEQLTIL